MNSDIIYILAFSGTYCDWHYIKGIPLELRETFYINLINNQAGAGTGHCRATRTTEEARFDLCNPRFGKLN